MTDNIIVGIVSDGAGTAIKGGQGASLVCKQLTLEAKQHFSEQEALPDDESIHYWIDRTRDLIYGAAKTRSLVPRDFAATLVLLISSGNETVIAHVGDGGAVVRTKSSGEWWAPTWPEQGAYASTTYFITDDIAPRVRINRVTEPVSAFALFTDGLERLALDFSGLRALPQFFDAFARPVANADIAGRNHSLSLQLRAFLDSDRVNARTDDDKSFILAMRR